ncbi:MAG: LacI family DNA-binding transcriptional regulator [Clostridium sp.]|nr:LacI family DNA-binding transcriptional regulator [Clostridium sp.]
MKDDKINIYAIAKEADVSPATVSRVLNNSTPVSEEKKMRVLEIIKKYDFKPNVLARRLSSNQSNIIGIMAADIRNPFYAALFVECEIAAKDRGYTVVLCNSLGKNELEDYHLEELYEQRVDAIIQIGGRVDEIVTDENYIDHVKKILQHIPIVVTGKLDKCECTRINLNESKAMEEVFEYLISLGHKEIAFIGGRKDVKSTYDKRNKYRKLIKKYGLEYRKEWIVEGRTYNIEGGYEGMNKLFKEGAKIPTSIIAINDFTAIGIIKSIKEHGLSIPDDISLASFDNTFVTEASSPRLTSISYDYKGFGEALIQAAIDSINGKKAYKKLISSKLVKRDSCKKMENK